MKPTPPNTSLETQDHGAILVLRFPGPQVRLGAQHLRLADAHLFGPGVKVAGREILLDLSNVENVASAALAGLVRLHSKLAEASGRLRLAGVNPHLYELLEVTHLHKLLDVRGNRGAGKALCPEFQGNADLAGRADLTRYGHADPQDRRLVRGWFERAWRSKDSPPQAMVVPFSYAWLALNGWAVCITGLEKNKDWMHALRHCRPIVERFAEMAADRDNEVAGHTRAFRECWPLFEAQEVRGKLGAGCPPGTPRRAVVEQYLGAGATRFTPPCWRRHTQDEGGECPVDWPHTISALYRVRCNLLQGDQGVRSEVEPSIVSRAFLVLIHFLAQSGYLR
jgi:anti-anti-sigma factor